jgi:hypothetical protein
MKEQLYRKVIIKTEADLPKETGIYFVYTSTGIHQRGFDINQKRLGLHGSSQDEWFSVNWYLEPIEEQESTEQDLKCENCDEPIPCDYLAECIKKAEPNLSKIKDVDQELAKIRGISKITDSDIEAWADKESLKPDEDNPTIKRVDAYDWDLLVRGAKAMRDNEIKHIK